MARWRFTVEAHYALRGGGSERGKSCGIFFDNISSPESTISWVRGATHYAFHGGSSHNDSFCGAFYVTIRLAAGHNDWGFGAKYGQKLF